MTKQHPFDDFHQRIHWSGTSIGTVTQQWGNPAPRHGWRLKDKKNAEALMSLLKR